MLRYTVTTIIISCLIIIKFAVINLNTFHAVAKFNDNSWVFIIE